MTNYYTNRTWCNVLDELRECYKTHNYSPMLGLLEELQIFGNRMEAALYDGKDIRAINEERHELLKELKKLKKKLPAKKKRK